VWLERVFVFVVGFCILWTILFVFTQFEQRLPLFIALFLTYVVSAYLLLPRIFFLTSALLRRGRIPCFTRSADGFPADPVNIILVGSKKDLEQIFETIGWKKADRLTLKSAWKMAFAFVLKKPYPRAPFSPLYLFGRRQDIGFQECLGGSPRKRNHIRFWLADVDPLEKLSDIGYWLNKNTLMHSSSKSVWVGAGVKDIGFGFTQFTYQMSHRIDKNIDKQRKYIVNALRRNKCIKKERFIEANTLIGKKYNTDGRIFYAHIHSS
jgi:hypothetical protein